MQVMMLQAAVLCLIGFLVGGGIGWLVAGSDKAAKKASQRAAKSQPVAKPFVAHNWDWETPAKAEAEVVSVPVAEPVRAAAPVVALFETPSAAEVFETQVSTPIASPTSVPEVAVETEIAYEDRSDRARLATAESTPISTLAVMTPDSVAAAVVQAGTGLEPMRLSTSQGMPDDLHIISGISPALEKTLNVLGIYHFWQVASWTPENVAWLAHRIDNGDRIARENWMAQAARLQQSRLAKLA
jgi:predicted flap endonuclease-1-like 5' DNA nuclease